MTSKHTPGPWAATPPDKRKPWNRWHIEGGNRLVAAASGPQFAIPGDEADANTRLIAEAPAMESSIRELLDLIDHIRPENSHHGEVQTARAILSRIGGEE